MDLESPEKKLREMELFKSFDFEPFLQPDRLYILYDLRDDLILSSSKHLDCIRYVPEVLSNTRVACLRSDSSRGLIERSPCRVDPRCLCIETEFAKESGNFLAIQKENYR